MRHLRIVFFISLACLASTRAQDRLQFGPGMMINGASSLPGAGIMWVRPWGESLSFGAESGLFLRNSPYGALTLPLLAAVQYPFRWNDVVTPTLGLSVGPVFSFGSGAKLVDFMFYVHPQVQYRVKDDLDLIFRTSFGLIGSSFAFYPLLGLSLPL